MYFDKSVAKKVGTDAAIILSNIEFWQSKNKANNKNFYDGYFWTYNSVSAWCELFDYLTYAQIRRCLEKLEKSKFIITGNYNSSSYDRTKWYCSIRQFQLLKLANGDVNSNQPIPYNKPNSNTDNKPKEKKFNFRKELLEFGFEEDLVSDWLKVRKDKKASNTKTALNGFINQVKKSNVDKNEILKICVERSWRSFKASWDLGLNDSKNENKPETAVERLNRELGITK